MNLENTMKQVQGFRCHIRRLILLSMWAPEQAYPVSLPRKLITFRSQAYSNNIKSEMTLLWFCRYCPHYGGNISRNHLFSQSVWEQFQNPESVRIVVQNYLLLQIIIKTEIICFNFT